MDTEGRSRYDCHMRSLLKRIYCCIVHIIIILRYSAATLT